jgi:RimJ/RimL family protein N-acetyltransferase
MNNYIISTNRLYLRHWLESDIEPFAKMNEDDAVMRFFPKKLTRKETEAMCERITLHFCKNNFGLFAVENKITGQFIGFTGFAIPIFESFFTPCVEIGWRFKQEVWGQGFATEAATACLRYGFDTFKFDKVMSFTSVLNTRSEAVMKKIGMRKVCNFKHPGIEDNHILSEHVLYEILKEDLL